MRILLLNQFFWPDAAPTGQLLAPLAEELARRGHQVTVLCGSSSYGAAIGDPPRNVEIVRIPDLPFSKTKLMRLASWGSFLVGATLRALLLPKQDVVLAMTTPPALSIIGRLLQLLRGSRFWIWEMDMYPDVAIGVGMLRENSLPARVIAALLNWPRRKATGILALGECMKQRIVAHGVKPERIHVAENWAVEDTGQAIAYPADGPLQVLYSGNLGLAHDVETICQVMHELREDRNIRFVFSGSGARRKQVESFAAERGLQNVLFRGFLSREAFAQLLADSHIGLITLLPACLGSVVPSKLYSLLAAGRPVLFLGPESALTARYAARLGCGWSFPTGQEHVAAIVAKLRELAKHPAALAPVGEHARQTSDRACRREDRVEALVRWLTAQ